MALIWVGAVQVDSGRPHPGGRWWLCYNYMSQILVELIKLANLIINITKALACMGPGAGCAGYPLLPWKPPRHSSGTAGRGGSVEFRGVGLTYQGAGGGLPLRPGAFP